MLHPDQIEARAAAMLGGEMIDEALCKMPWAIMSKGRAAGLPAPRNGRLSLSGQNRKNRTLIAVTYRELPNP